MDEPHSVVHRYVKIPCPSGKHARSIVTFRDHTVASMFCAPCDVAWDQSIDHPELQHLRLDRV